MKKTVIICAMLVMGAFLGGCAKKAKIDPQAGANQPVAADKNAGQDVSGASQKPVNEAPAVEAKSAEKLVTIYFDFDSYVLSDASRENLTRNASWLKNNSQVKITIEGHADERGSDEYNLALGEKRARIAKEFLESLGIPSERLNTISYGEEKPAVQGSDESAWSKNRRAEFL